MVSIIALTTTNAHKDKHTNKCTNGQTNKWTNKQMHNGINRQQTDIQIHKQTLGKLRPKCKWMNKERNCQNAKKADRSD